MDLSNNTAPQPLLLRAIENACKCPAGAPDKRRFYLHRYD
jgi:hypothetical protein